MLYEVITYQMYCDAQTSGGLLIAMDREDAKEYIKKVEELTYGYATIIGEVIPSVITSYSIHYTKLYDALFLEMQLDFKK